MAGSIRLFQGDRRPIREWHGAATTATTHYRRNDVVKSFMIFGRVLQLELRTQAEIHIM
jgi:hypothetical protein